MEDKRLSCQAGVWEFNDSERARQPKDSQEASSRRTSGVVPGRKMRGLTQRCRGHKPETPPGDRAQVASDLLVVGEEGEGPWLSSRV